MKEKITINAEWVCTIFRLDDGSLVINGVEYTFTVGPEEKELKRLFLEIMDKYSKNKSKI